MLLSGYSKYRNNSVFTDIDVYNRNAYKTVNELTNISEDKNWVRQNDLRNKYENLYKLRNLEFWNL